MIDRGIGSWGGAMDNITLRLQAALEGDDPADMREALSMAIDEIETLRTFVVCGGCRSDTRICEELGSEACYRKPYPR